MARQSMFPEARAAGHLIGAVAGAASLVGGAEALMHSMPPVLGATMLIIGGALIALVLMSFQSYSRIAWSFLNAIMVVMALVTLFGSPKVRTILHIPLGAAMAIPFVLALGVIALALVAEDYRGTLSQKSQSAPR